MKQNCDQITLKGMKMSVLIGSHHLPPSGYSSSGRRRAGEAPEPDSRCRMEFSSCPRRSTPKGGGGGRNSFHIQIKPHKYAQR